ncbi:MAG: hypothetical protein ABIQ39_10125, partial [Ilumatobacteraceae bacterium]
MSASANERAYPAHQPATAASNPAEAEAEDLANLATGVGDATRHERNATSDRTRSAPNGLHDSSADRDKP